MMAAQRIGSADFGPLDNGTRIGQETGSRQSVQVVRDNSAAQ